MLFGRKRNLLPVPLDAVQAGPNDHAGNLEVLVEHGGG